MEVYLSLAEIRRRVMATVGMSPSAIAVAQAMDQLNQFITEGNHETMLRRRWVRQLSSIRVQIGTDQNNIPFPANWGPESIVEAAFWDTNSNLYVPIPRKKISLIRTADPLNDPTSPSFSPSNEAARQGMPAMYEPGPGGVISIWPPSDQPYELKFQGYPNPELLQPTDISVVDGICITYWATACYFDIIQDMPLANIQRQKFENRVGLLHAWQSSGQSIAIDAEATFDDNRFEFGIPRYDFETGRAPGV